MYKDKYPRTTKEQIKNEVNPMELKERAYWTHEVASKLEIGESTLRKWCIEIEKNGYSFLKGEQDSRAFLEADISVLIRLKELVRDKRETVKKAATIAAEEARTPPVHTVITKDQSENTLPVQIEQSTSLFTLNEVRNMIREELDEREKERVKERDQALLTVMKELQEIKRNIAASHEKQRWWKFWKK